MGVPEIIKTQLRKSALYANRLKAPQDIALFERRAYLPRENQPVL